MIILSMRVSEFPSIQTSRYGCEKKGDAAKVLLFNISQYYLCIVDSIYPVGICRPGTQLYQSIKQI